MDYEEMYYRSLEHIEHLEEEIVYLNSEIQEMSRDLVSMQRELADNNSGRGYHD